MSDLVANYHAVASKLRQLAQTGEVASLPANRAADFIANRVDQEEVRSAFGDIERDYVDQLRAADDIKARGNMTFRVDALDEKRSHVTVEINAKESAQDAKAMFAVAKKIYEVIFQNRMSNYVENTHGIPRTCEFDVTGELKDLFDTWQLNRQPNDIGVKRA